MIDFSTLDDPNIQKILQEIEEAKVKYDYTPTYVDYLTQFMNNYFITNYTEQALQIINRCPYGKVYNSKTGRPIVGVKVTVHNEDGSIVALDKASNPTTSNPQITDATGRYGVKLRTGGKYYITATAEGYEDYQSPVFTEKWHVLREDIALTPKEEML